MFISDSSGRKSLTATLAVISFIVVMIKVLLNGTTVSLGGASYAFGTIDGLTIGAIFTPILGSYTARRWNDTSTPPVVTDSAGSKPSDGAA